jgi:hypothetical protein
MLQAEVTNLWELARSGQPIDATSLASAIAAQSAVGDPDYRTELLIRDSLDALSQHWGEARLKSWLSEQPQSERILSIWQSPLGPAGFPSLLRRIMDATRPETLLAFFRELGTRITGPARLNVGGSSSLILSGLLARHTDDIGVVDEVPADIRSDHDLLHELAGAYGLNLTHFQSHYLPIGWQSRVRSLGGFGRLTVYVVDVCDMLVSKLTSARRKDRDDLRAVAKSIDKAAVAERLTVEGAELIAESKLLENARTNWYIVYGETLPV